MITSSASLVKFRWLAMSVVQGQAVDSENHLLECYSANQNPRGYRQTNSHQSLHEATFW
jgi:hypothetical protein